jgi:hypothetical protein
MKSPVLLIACGALAREIVELKRLNNWTHLKIKCLPAELHNRPEKIPEAVRAEIEDKRDEFEQIFVAYADCGTGGLLDKVLAEYGVDRLSEKPRPRQASGIVVVVFRQLHAAGLFVAIRLT